MNNEEFFILHSSFLAPLHALVHPLDPHRAPGHFVDLDERSRKPDVALRDFHLPRRVERELLEDLLRPEADDRVVRAAHADVGLKRRSLRENPLVRVPGEFLYIGRVMGMLGGLGAQLGSEVNLMTVLTAQLPSSAAAS